MNSINPSVCLQGQTNNSQSNFACFSPTELPSIEPNSNTGVNPVPLQFGIGWLTFTFRTPSGTSSRDFAEYLGKVYERQAHDYFVKNSYGFNSYVHSRRYRSGAFLAWSEDREDLCLSLTQQSLDRLTSKSVAKLIYRLKTLKGCKATRMDVYFDDYEKHITPSRVLNALKSGCHPSKSIQFKIIQSYAKDEVESDTVYIGSKASDFYVRVYNKALESQGRQDCTRLEFQLRSEVADTFFNTLIYRPYQEWGQAALQLFLDRFDFVYRKGPRNDRTDKRLPWWSKLVGNLSRIGWRVQMVKSKLLSTLAWAENVLPTTLHMLSRVMGVEGVATWTAGLLRIGAIKLRRKHLAMLAEFEEEMHLAVS